MPFANDHPKNLRLEAKLTQRELSELSGVDARTISRFETGGSVSSLTVVKISQGLSQALGREISSLKLLSSDPEEGKPTKNSDRLSVELSEKARTMLDALRTNRSYDFLSLIEDTDVERDALRRLMDLGTPLPPEVAQKIIDYISRDVREVDEIDVNEVGFTSQHGIADFLQRELMTRGLTQAQLAERLGFSRQSINSWVIGRSIPSRNGISAIAEFFGIEVRELEALASSGDVSISLSGRGPREELKAANKPEIGEESIKKLMAAVDKYIPTPERVGLQETAASIPDQSPLIRFGVSENAKVNLVPTPNDQNDYSTIEVLRSELLEENGPINHLEKWYSQNKNIPQASMFGSLTKKYAAELAKDPSEINYTLLYARGSRFYSARKRAAEQVASGEWPELDAEENEAIDAICDLHGPLILASAAGRKLVSDAREFETTPERYREEEELLQEFGAVLAAQTEIFEPDTAEAIEDLTAVVPNDLQPARSRGTRMVFAGSALSVVVGGAAWYAAGGVVAAVVVPATLVGAVGLGGAFLWEVTKKTERFKKATDDLAKQTDSLIDQAEGQADQQQKALLKKMSDLVEGKRPLFEKVANLRPEFGWAKKFLHRPRAMTSIDYFNVVDAVEETTSSLSNSAKSANLELRIKAPDNDLLAIGEQQSFVTALAEILTNAIVHSRNSIKSGNSKDYQWIDISVRGQYGFRNQKQVLREILVQVTDRGGGITEDDQSRIFSPGFRGQDARVTGRGTGLSVVRELLEANKGTISVSSDGKSGSTFSLALSAYQAD